MTWSLFLLPLTWIWISVEDSDIVASVCEKRERERGGSGEGRDLEGFVSATTGVDCRGWAHLPPHGNDNTPPLPNRESHHRNRSRIQPRPLTHHLPTSFILEMGNRESASNDGIFSSLDRSSVLEARDLRSVAKYMKSDECQNVYVMVCSISPTNIHNAQCSAIPSYLSRHRIGIAILA